jgi:uncharacterized repeat protein (TIGR03803 family)
MRVARVLALCLLPALAAAQSVQPVQLVHRFDPSPSHPHGAMVEVPDGSLYGLADDGIYRVAPDGTVTIAARTHEGLDATTARVLNDYGPDAALIRGPDGALYGTRRFGGSGGRGVVFRFDPVTAAVRTLHAFDGSNEGANPVGGLTVAGGSLYGVTRQAIFRTDPATGATEVVYRFPELALGDPNRLESPSSPLTLGGDGFLYGTTRYGSGPPEGGTLYRFDPNARTVTVLHRFATEQTAYPVGRLLSAADGWLYGASQGEVAAGSVWRFNPVTSTFAVLHAFALADGVRPGPVVMTPDGSLFGTTHLRNSDGYIADAGVAIFRLRPVSGAYTLEIVRTFDAASTGAGVRVELTLGTDGWLYGYAQTGGPAGAGTVYRFQPASNPLVFTVLHAFAPTTTWLPSAPTEGADTLLYGTLSRGGANQRGAIYRLNRATDQVTLLADIPGPVPGTQDVFNSALLWDPTVGRLYGTTATGTTVSNEYRVVQVAVANGAITIPLQVSTGTPGTPAVDSPFVRDPAGNLYFTRRRPTRDDVYRYSPTSQTLAIAGGPPDPGSLGETAMTDPVAASDGRIYIGVLTAVDAGVGFQVTTRLMRVNPASSDLEEVVNLGAASLRGLLQGMDGGLYMGGFQDIRLLDPVARTSRVVCQLPAAEILEHLSAVPGGRLVGVTTHQTGADARQSLAICTPSTGAVETRSLPRGIGRITAPLVFAGGWLYGATHDAVPASVSWVLADLAQPGGAIIRLSLDSTLPLTDADADGLPNTWETAYGLDPFDAGGAAGGTGDADGDGRTNAEEFADGTHPRGVLVRYFAEGAANAFFHTRFDIANPTGAAAATVLLRFLTDAGQQVSHQIVVPPFAHASLDPATLPGLANTSFSTVVEADQHIAVDRTMAWDASGYGSHLETGVATPAATWYFAEGSTSGPFALFYLLENPQETAVTATVRYLRPGGVTPIEKTYALAPLSRRTIVVDDEGAELASTDVSAVITASAPIVAERAMYFTQGGVPFAAGHESAGVTAPALEWFLAEGATGSFFDLFVLLANPNPSAATVQIEYLLVGGGTLTKSYTVPGNSRATVWVDDEQVPAGSGQKPLADVAVSMSVRSTNLVPIIVERTMWWPGPAVTPNFWYEAHNSPGATATATRWLAASGEIDAPNGAQTYVLIANPASTAAQVRVVQFADGVYNTSSRIVDLPATSRTTLSYAPPLANGRFSVLVESIGAPAVPIVVEHATYASPGALLWSSGGNALAAPLP